MGVKTGETKLLGAPWNKTVDTIEVAYPAPIVKVTKREIPSPKISGCHGNSLREFA